MIQIKISIYKEAAQLINEVGILPLAPLIPNHPSLYEITFGDQWLTGTETDPWLWRTRLPSDGAAAYGKFIKKKPILISRELFPWVKVILVIRTTTIKKKKNGDLFINGVQLSFLDSDSGAKLERFVKPV
ncbi:hypothetical protein LOZ80_19920 [Paenibacillus sp. HWE-109]|uniref:AlkZ-related protein n=1 Tax=Paenibacillus sp. HWE-109 TaxID=1306526 RepID=UPI001EE0F778|nr:hypothetical protein [Paenibacillus sp. HWE-109]UKS23912.1 hypothetical protein LOZ80_19920 [Paenibacillus sp. HWE-109]